MKVIEWFADPRCTEEERRFLSKSPLNKELGACWGRVGGTVIDREYDPDNCPTEICNQCELAGFCRMNNADEEHFKISRNRL